MLDKEPSAPKNSLPFFTRFLEGQSNTGPNSVTYKYPSDLDEIVTMKYPSDDDEAGDDRAFGGILQTGGASNPGSHQTLKYPSDRDEWD